MAKKFSVLSGQPAKAVEANVKGRVAQNKAQNTITRDEVKQMGDLLGSMTTNQRNALDQAVNANINLVEAARGSRLENDKVWQYANAIIELTNEDGTVNYKPGKYQFNPYADGKPDETARKAYNKLSGRDQLMLEIDSKGKVKTPDFGDPNVDTTAYDNYQRALLEVEAAEIERADNRVRTAVEDAYKKHRGEWDYDFADDAEAIVEANKGTGVTKTEAKNMYKALQDQYDWDEEAYSAWASPAAAMPSARNVVPVIPSKQTAQPVDPASAEDNKNDGKSNPTLEQRIVQATTPKESDKVKAAAAAQGEAVGNIFARWGKQYNQLTGNDDGEQKTSGQFATDALNVFLSGMQGMMDVAGDVANAVSHTIRETNALYRKYVKGDDSEIREGEFSSKYPVAGWIVDAASAFGDASEQLDEKRSTYLKATTGRTEASDAGKKVADVARTVTNNAARVYGFAALAPVNALNTALYMVASAGGTYDEMLENGYTKMDAAGMAVWNACTEAIIERYSDKILLSGGKGMKSVLNGIAGNGRLGNNIRKGAAALVSKYGMPVMRMLVTGAASEGVEEYIQYWVGKAGEKLVLGDTIEPASQQEALRQAAMGAVCGAIFSAVGVAGDSVYNASVRARGERMAEQMVVEGKAPTVEEVIQLSEDTAQATLESPMTQQEVETAEQDGLVLPEAVKANYKQATDALTTSEQSVRSAYTALKDAQQTLPFGDPQRVAAVKRYTDAVKQRNKDGEAMTKAYAKLREAISDTASEMDTEMLQRAQIYQEQANQISQYRFERDAVNDPEGMRDVLAQQESALTVERDRIQMALDALPANSARARELFSEVQQLNTAIQGVQQLAQQIPAAVAPTTIVEIPANVGAGLTQAFDEANLSADARAVLNQNRDQLKVVDTIAKRYGRRVMMVDTLKGKTISGQTITEDVNGFFDPKTGAIYIAADAQEGAFSYFAIHELVHSIKNSDPEGYEALCDTIMEELVKNGEDVDALIDYQQNAVYQGSIDLETAIEEVVANTAPAILTDENYVRSMYEGNRTLFDKIRDFFNELKQAFTNLTQYRSWEQGASLGADSVAKIADVFDRVAATPDGGGGNGARFSMKEPVERVGSLVAVHSLNHDNAMKAIQRGGIPAPSLAITNSAAGIPEYGDISFFADSASVNPEADERNKMYAGDAHSPRYPEVSMGINDAAQKRIGDVIEKHAGKLSDEYIQEARKIQNSGESSDKWMLSDIKDNAGMMAVYLAERKAKVPRVESGKRVWEYGDKLKSMIRWRGGEKKYLQWAMNLLGEDWNTGEYVNMPTDGGSTRVPATLENVARVMSSPNGGELRNALGTKGLRGLHASLVRQMGDLEQVRARERMITGVTPESRTQYREAQTKLDQVVNDIKAAANPNYEYKLTRPSATELINHIVKEQAYSEQAMSAMLANKGYIPDKALVKNIADMLSTVRNLPVDYFEAKLARVFGIDEVKLALLPEGKYPDLVDALKNAGIDVAFYNGTKADRTAVMNERAAQLMFSRKDFNRSARPSAAEAQGSLAQRLIADNGSRASFAVPDFANRETKYGKQAAADWLDQTHKAGTADADIAAYAETRKLTGTTAKERAFWENVEGAMAQTRNGKPKVMAFKPTPQQETQGDVVKVLDETSPYMQADSTDMKHASSTYPTVRNLASIKNDIQNTLGFRYSDEHFVRAQRKVGAVAYYEPTGRFVVSDDTNNLPAFLHEAGHHMALDQYNEDEVNAFKQNVPRKFLDEYPEGAQVQEAGAEMFRAWMMDPEFMERNYPETFDAMRNALGKGKYNRLRDESAAVRKWMDADVEKRVSSTQVTTREQEKARKKNFAWSDFIKKEADTEYGYKKLDRIMQRNGVTLAASADARAACARTSSEVIHALMFDGMYDPKTGQKIAGALTETTRGLIVTAEDKQTLEVYLELKQSLDRYEKNNKDWTFSKNVCTPAEAKAYVESVENNKKNVVDAAKNLWKWLEKYRHTQLSGAIPQSVIDEWDTLNPHYIPQTRVFTDNVRAAVRGGKTGDGTGVNRRKVGSTRDFLSPIDAIVQMVAKTKTAAMKHETLLALQEYYDAGEAYAGDFLHEVEPGVHITPVDGLTVTKAAVNALERGGMDAEMLQQVNDLLDGNSPETRVYRYGAPNGRNNNIVAITQDGHTRYFEVRDQDLMDAIAPMNRQQLGSFLTAVSKVNRQISALITSKNPLFAGSNAIRDFVTGYAFGSTKNPIKYVGDYVSAARDVAKNTDAARQYRAMGGGGGLAQSFANADQVNDVTAAMFGRAGDDRNAFKRALDTVGNKLDEFNGGIETIPRLAEYKRQLEKGASYAEAIKTAKNLTTDFSTGGTHSKIMNTLWRFYGAQVNGLYKTFNLFADKNNTEQTKKDFNKTIGAISGIAVAGALWHFALHLLDDEDEYAALPDYIKDDNYIIPYGGGKFVRIPKPNDPLLVALDSMSRNLADVALRIQPGVDVGDVVKEEGIDLLGDIASIILPFGDWNKSNPLGSNFVGAPVMQWAYNKTWTGADIVPSYMEDVSPALQYDDKTSWASRQIGKVFNISPMKLDNLFDQSSGVIGEVVDAFSAGVDAAEQGGIVKGVGAGLKEALLSRFLVDSAYSQNVTGGFYDAKDELTQFIEDVERNIDMENLPYSPIMKNLGPSETNMAYKEAKNMAKKINDLSKTLSDIGKQATQYANQGNEERAREMKYKQQELAAEASLIIADFFDKWKNQ